MIEAINLVPDFLEDLVSNNLLDALSGGIIRMEPLCQIALERSIPDVADVLTISIVADFGGGFEQLRLYHQGANLPALPLLLDRRRSRAGEVSGDPACPRATVLGMVFMRGILRDIVFAVVFAVGTVAVAQYIWWILNGQP